MEFVNAVSRRMRNMTWSTFGLLMCPVIALYFVISDTLLQSITYDIIGLIAIVAMVGGLLRNRPPYPRPWLLLTGGMILTSGGNLLWTLHDAIVGGDPPFPWYADAIYLAGYPFMAAAVFALLRARQPGGNRAALIDALIVTVGLSAAVWVFLITPHLHDNTLSAFGQAVAMAYPAMDIVLLVVAARVVAGGGLRHPTLLLLLGGIICYLIADTYYGWAVLEGRYQSGDPIDLGWLVADVAFAMAILHPSVRTVDQQVGSRTPAPLSMSRLVLLGGVALSGPVLLAIRQATTTDQDTIVLIVASGVLFILALIRVGDLTMDLATALEERVRAERQLLTSEARFRGAFEHAPIGMALVDCAGEWRDVNQALCDMLGYAADELRGVSWWTLLHPDDVESATPRLTGDRANAEPRERRYLKRDGHIVWTIQSISSLPGGEGSVSMILQLQDITTQKQLEIELRRLSLTDPLTGLPNRALFADRLAHALTATRPDECVAVLFIDLDRFKAINDRLGHAQGDHLLQAVAERLASIIRAPDTIARYGGDEFVAILESLPDPSQASAMAARILDAIQEPLHLGGGIAGVDASIGVAVGWPGRTIAEDLVRHADLALYRAKAMGRATYAIFDAGLDAEAIRRRAMEHDLRRAIEREEFVVHYQPIVDLHTRRITGAEALVRWEHPVRGLVSPADFIELAEETGLIVPLGTQVLKRACREAVTWQAGELRPMLNVNVSPRQFHETDFVSTLAEILAETGFPANQLRLELTEHSLIEEGPATVETVRALTEMGVSLAIDDFGIGYSSLTSLRHLPVGTVKIDRSFISGLTDTPGTGAIIEAIVALARALNLDVTAEGIETEEQYARVRRVGCTRAQGYLLGRPVPAHDFSRTITAQYN